MYLIVDCETNGLPENWQAPITDLSNWPRVVQIAWAAYDEQHRQTDRVCRIIKPEGFRIPRGVSCIHGITTKRANAEGIPVQNVLYDLQCAAANARYFIAHNASFDGSVIAAEFLRLDWQPPFLPHSMICTMQQSTRYCRLSGYYGYKWPKLEELYKFLFGTAFTGAHDAGIDAAACARCFFELKKRGVIRVPLLQRA